MFSVAAAVRSYVAFGVPFRWGNSGQALVVLLITLTALYAVRMTAASAFLRFGRGVEKAMETLQEPIYLLTASYFPVRSLGIGAAIAGSAVPLTLGLDALRQLLLPGDAFQLLDWSVEALLLVGYTIITLFAARAALAKMERLAKREGTLTLRWQ